MDKTSSGHQLWEFICEDVCPRHVERNYVPLFGVDTDLRYYVIRDVNCGAIGRHRLTLLRNT